MSDLRQHRGKKSRAKRDVISLALLLLICLLLSYFTREREQPQREIDQPEAPREMAQPPEADKAPVVEPPQNVRRQRRRKRGRRATVPDKPISAGGDVLPREI